jgi:general stress protein YciG
MRGYFQHLTPEARRELARKGGKASTTQWTREQASAAGRKGGAVSRGAAGRAVIEAARRHASNESMLRSNPERARRILADRFWS